VAVAVEPTFLAVVVLVVIAHQSLENRLAVGLVQKPL
jgi:hypothetical protein